jgi:hypothetical protein
MSAGNVRPVPGMTAAGDEPGQAIRVPRLGITAPESFRQVDHDGNDAQRGQRQEDEGKHDCTGCVASLKYPGPVWRTQ